MCLPVAALAAVSLGASALGAVTGAIGSYYGAKGQQTQLQLQAATAATQARLAGINGENALATAKTNSDLVLALGELNASTVEKTTDLNVQIAQSVSNFNTQVADGEGNILTARGALAATADKINAGVDEENAQQALVAGQQEEQSSRLNYARLKSTQRATLAANGVALDEGSALRIQTDTDYFSDVDASTIHANAVRAAMGYRVQENNDNAAAGFATLNAATEAFNVKAQALGAKIQSDRDVLNMKVSSSFEAIQDRGNAAIQSLNINQQGRVAAFNAQLQALGYNAQASAAEVTSAGINPALAAAGSLIGGVGSVASKWYSYTKSGALGG